MYVCVCVYKNIIKMKWIYLFELFFFIILIKALLLYTMS